MGMSRRTERHGLLPVRHIRRLSPLITPSAIVVSFPPTGSPPPAPTADGAKGILSRDYLSGTCPIVGSSCARTRSNRGAAQRLERLLTDLGVDHDIKEHPDAGHSFVNDHNPAQAPAEFVVLAKLSLNRPQALGR